MPTNLSTTVRRIKSITNQVNSKLIFQFHEFMKENGASERHQNNNLKAVLSFAIYLDYKLLEQVDKKEDVITFLQIHDIVNPLDFLNLVMNILMRYSIR